MAAAAASEAGVTFAVNDVRPEKWATRLARDPQWVPRVMGAMAPPAAGGRDDWRSFGPGPKAAAADLVCPDSATEHPHLLKAQPHGHGFVSAIATAFDKHLPLALRPETLWVLILQGVSREVNAHPEELRARFVAHAGKEELEVIRDEWAGMLGRPGLDWPGVVAEFSEQIDGKTIDGVAEMLATDFSSTTAVEATVAKVTVMDMLQEFFEYKMSTRCGFPSITLEGTADDWRALRAKALTLVNEKCTAELAGRWAPALESVLDRFVAQVENPATVDVEFWQSMCKRGGVTGSGGYTYLNGWFNVFLPYLKANKPNHFCEPYRPGYGYAAEPLGENLYSHFGKAPPKGVLGPEPADLPSGMASAPVKWDYLGTEIPLSFRAGFVGAGQRDDGTVFPEVGWCIVREPAGAA